MQKRLDTKWSSIRMKRSGSRFTKTHYPTTTSARAQRIFNTKRKGEMITSDFAQRLADKLIEQLKAGTAPWQQPWEAGQQLSPYNPTTGNRYRGLNILALMASDYADPRWMTYRQAQAQGWQVRAGEKGTQIQHWIWEEARTRLGKDGNPELDNEGKPIKELVRLSRPKVMVAAVFNAEQIDGVPALEPERTYD